MRTRIVRTTRRHRRSGMTSMELVLSLPMLLLLLMVFVDFSFLMSARGHVVQAARGGARIGVLNGASPQAVETEVARILGPGFPAYQVHSQLGEYSGDPVSVTVRVPMTSAAPNLVWPVGYNIRGRELVAQVRMLKE